MEITSIFCLCFYVLCRRGNNHFDLHFRRSHVSWVPCQNLTSFFWTHKFGLVPWLFLERPETLICKTGRPLGIAPQTIPTPKWGIFLSTLANLKAQGQKSTLTWWQELQKKFATTLTWRQQLRKKFPTSPLLLRQANKRRRAPQVSHIFAKRMHLRQLRQTRFCWPFNIWRRTLIQPISITTSAQVV